MEIPHLEQLYPEQLYNNDELSDCDVIYGRRIDLTHLKVYTIDPPNCVDADDGFSIKFTDIPEIYKLYVHIADPTAYIKKYDDHYNNAIHNCVTQYPSMCEPKHMLPYSILEKSSLMNGRKPALTIEYSFNYERCIDKCLIFSYINCDPKYKHTYESAADIIDNNWDIFTAFKSSILLSNERNKKFNSLSSMKNAIVDYDELKEEFVFKTYSEKVGKLKNMIAELAIASNSYIAQYIQNFNDDYTFSRNCIDTGATESDNPNDTLASIVKNGIRAKYDANDIRHDIVGSKLYTHFTSPIRRASDIIVHLILKDIFLLQPSFSNQELTVLSTHINQKNKKIQNIQRLDAKYRLFQAIQNMIKTNSVIIKFRFMSYSGLFINLIIEQVNEFSVYGSYCIRCKPEKYKGSSFLENNVYSFKCTECNLPTTKFDTGVLPDLEKIFIKD